MSTVTVDQMRDKLWTLEKAREVLSATEPLSQFQFATGDEVRFRVEPGWNHGIDAMGATDRLDKVQIKVGPGPTAPEFVMSRDALLQATSAVGIPKAYASRCPAELLEPQLNYWFRNGMPDKEYKLLTAGPDNLGVAVVKSAIQPFSNLGLMEKMLDGIVAKYGAGEVLVDYKFRHDLRGTALRLIVPESRRTITGAGTVDDDQWSVGIQLRNSLVGEKPTELNGYLFRWWCTNGAIDTHSATGAFSRRGGSEVDVYEWARQAVDGVLGGLEPALDHVQAMTEIPIEGIAATALNDVFQLYKIPTKLRDKVMEEMVEATELNMYTLMQAVTRVANEVGLESGHTEMLMRAGGDLPHRADSRCDACHRINV